MSGDKSRGGRSTTGIGRMTASVSAGSLIGLLGQPGTGLARLLLPRTWRRLAVHIDRHPDFCSETASMESGSRAETPPSATQQKPAPGAAGLDGPVAEPVDEERDHALAVGDSIFLRGLAEVGDGTQEVLGVDVGPDLAAGCRGLE